MNKYNTYIFNRKRIVNYPSNARIITTTTIERDLYSDKEETDISFLPLDRLVDNLAWALLPSTSIFNKTTGQKISFDKEEDEGWNMQHNFLSWWEKEKPSDNPVDIAEALTNYIFVAGTHEYYVEKTDIAPHTARKKAALCHFEIFDRETETPIEKYTFDVAYCEEGLKKIRNILETERNIENSIVLLNGIDISDYYKKTLYRNMVIEFPTKRKTEHFRSKIEINEFGLNEKIRQLYQGQALTEGFMRIYKDEEEKYEFFKKRVEEIKSEILKLEQQMID